MSLTLIVLSISCKNERSQAEITSEQLLIKENEIKQKKLEIEQARIDEELAKEQERQEKIREQEQFQKTVDNEVSGYINKIFLKWGSSWAIDNYIDESAKIEHFEKNNKSLTFEGKFKFNRFGNIKTGRFEGVINLNDNEMLIKELCYFFESESSCI